MKKNNNGIIIAVIIVVGILLLNAQKTNLPSTPTPAPQSATPTPIDTNININVPTPIIPTPEPYSDKILPTSLSASISPLVIDMNGYAGGTVTSNGRNFAISTTATFITGSQTTEVAGFVDDDGMWDLWQQINSAGFWQFQTISENGIKSNIVYLEVRGMMIRADKTTISRLRGNNDVVFTVYSNHRSSNININMCKGGDLSLCTSIGTGRTNRDGFYQATIAVPMTTISNFMFDVDMGRTDAAHLYTYGNCWVNIMR